MKKNSLLWSVQLPDSNTQHYLFGTIHAFDERIIHLINTLTPFIASCQIFASELDIIELQSSDYELDLSLPPDTHLKQMLSRSTWKQWEWLAKKHFQIPADTILQLHPLEAISFIDSSLIENDFLYFPDKELYQIAQNLGKTCTGIETMQEHFDILYSISPDKYLRYLTWVIKNLRKHRRQIQKIIALYLVQDLQQLHQLLRKNARSIQKKILQGNRNHLMTTRFIQLAKKDSLFAAVGAAHLPGGNGMLRLLKRRGCVVKPIIFMEQ